ncbi:MAG: diguanylate cyclase [Candidatus Omnitrophica bacterium]|nr:diguanylate cyclase [Candidatus Omnitrophota bacterium]
MQDQRHPVAAVRMLLVDDDPDFAKIIQISLRVDKRVSFEIETAHTLESALKILQKKNFQMILLDLGLPDSRGLETFEKIAAAHPEIACVILSGTDDEVLSLEAVKKGAQDYVVKGEVGSGVLARILSYALERHLQKQQKVELNEHLEKLSFLDPLTQLLNRRGLQRMLTRELEISGREGANLSVILIDLDNFKPVNDTLGHAMGDIVLQEISKILKKTVRMTDHVSRVGGDEFIILLPNTRLVEGIHFSERIRLAISQTTVVGTDGQKVKVTASLGVLSVEKKTASVDALLEETHVALAKSKRSGKNRVSTGDGRGMRSDNVADMLRTGSCFWSVKQPIWNLGTGKIMGFEFFPRTNIGGFEMPGEFFNFCKENNILSVVDQRCLEIVLAAAKRVPPGAEKHVNIFPSTLAELQPKQFSRLFPPVSLCGAYCVEVSEQQILGDPSYLVPAVQELKKRKISVAIDDVGFGRSCLESLIILQPDVIKIDKRLVIHISHEKSQKEILRRLLAVVESLDAKIIAEGIESREDLETLKELGVPYGQGFFWGQPA